MERFEVQSIGRLALARVNRLATLEDVEAYASSFAAMRAKAGDVMLCADHRRVGIYSPAVTDRLVAMFIDMNTLWDRAALVADASNVTFCMQLQRLIRESKKTSRQLFNDPAAAEAFLHDALTPLESTKLHSFLALGPS